MNLIKKLTAGLLSLGLLAGAGTAIGLSANKSAVQVHAADESTSGSYALVTSTAGIAAGDTVIMMNNAVTKGLSGLSTTSNIYGTLADDGLTVSLDKSLITLEDSSIEELSVEAGSASGSFSFKGTDSFTTYLRWTGSKNTLDGNATKAANTSWTLEDYDADDGMTIANKNTPGRIIRFNSDRFACYTTSTGTLVRLYKKLAEQTITSEGSATSVAVGDTLQLYSDAETEVTWESSNDDIATVDDDGLVTGVAGGSATITAQADGYADAEFQLTVTSDDPYVTLDKSSFSGYTLESTTLTATYDNLDGTLTWKTSNASVASISSTTGNSITVTLVSGSNGSATVTAYDSENEATVYASCSITVTGISVFYKLTDASKIYSGMKVALVYETASKVAAAFNTSYFEPADATYLSGSMLKSNEATKFTIGGTVNSWTLTTASGVLGTSAAKSVNVSGTGTTTWTLTIDEGNVLLSDTDGKGTMKYNTGSPRFTTYASGQASIQLYAMADENAIYSFIRNYMKMGDTAYAGKGTGACKTGGDSSPYKLAKAAFNDNEVLTAEERAAFFNESNTQYEAARLRLTNWAMANGESFNTTENVLKAANTNLGQITNLSKEYSATTVIIIVSIVGIVAIGGYFVFRRRKEY